MRRILLSVVGLFAVGAVAVAADAVAVKLSDFKIKPTNAGVGAELYGHDEAEGKLFLYVNATAAAEFEAKEDGEVKVVIEASGTKGEKDLPKFKLTVGGTVIEKSFLLKETDAKAYTFKATVKKGKQKIEIEFLNDEYKENEYDSNLFVHSVKVEK
jgi:Ca-dependent carbohydrate-binding module xylan-binding